ncbi:MAG: hypothetical protein IPI49_25880 [Myxococcales bacterium]|nr:hypothetical protein [Myxococcales bacterium]HRC59059.1 hypothetical protein [Kofleriaceae bacterium]
MTFTDAVYLAALIEAVLFFAAGYMFRSSRAAVRAQAQVPNQPEVGVEELIRELEREQHTRRQHEQTIQQLQQMIGQLQVR